MLKNYFFYYVTISALWITVIGCSTQELTKYEDDNSCSTTLEGNYYKETTSNCDHPAVFLKMELAPKLLRGKLMRIDSSGVLFDPDNVGFYDEDPTLYSYDTLYGVINEEGKLIHGKIPKFYAVNQRLVLEIEKSKTRQLSQLNLYPNEPFAYCIEPGEYEIEIIKFIDEDEIEHIGYDFPALTFQIDSGKSNYLGNVFVDYKTRNDENVIIIPCTNYDKQSSAAAGMFGGLIGSIVYSVANSAENEGLHHVIDIVYDRNFLPESNKDVNNIEITISENSIGN